MARYLEDLRAPRPLTCPYCGEKLHMQSYDRTWWCAVHKQIEIDERFLPRYPPEPFRRRLRRFLFTDDFWGIILLVLVIVALLIWGGGPPPFYDGS